MNRNRRPERPPLWLAAAAVAAAWAALYDVVVWVVLFVRQPVHPDFRIFYVAAEAVCAYDRNLYRGVQLIAAPIPR